MAGWKCALVALPMVFSVRGFVTSGLLSFAMNVSALSAGLRAPVFVDLQRYRSNTCSVSREHGEVT